MSATERFTRADAVRIVEHVRDRLEKGWAPSAAIGLIVHALHTYPASADVPAAPTERERCPTCDHETADGEHHSWSATPQTACTYPPVDWRARALAAEARLAGGDASEQTPDRLLHSLPNLGYETLYRAIRDRDAAHATELWRLRKQLLDTTPTADAIAWRRACNKAEAERDEARRKLAGGDVRPLVGALERIGAPDGRTCVDTIENEFEDNCQCGWLISTCDADARTGALVPCVGRIARAAVAAYRAHERTEGRAGDGEGER